MTTEPIVRATQGLVVPAKLIEMYEVPLEDLKDKNEDYTLVLMTMQNWCLVRCAATYLRRRAKSPADSLSRARALFSRAFPPRLTLGSDCAV